MAIQKITVSNIPLSKNVKLNVPLDKNDYNFSATIHFDDGGIPGGVVKQPCIITHHGSGTTDYASVSEPVILKLIAKGFNVISFRHFGAGDSSNGITSSQNTMGASNYSSWQYYANKGAWTVQASLEFWLSVRDTYFTQDQVCLWGHSQGSNFILGWAANAGSPGLYDSSVVRCAFCNGITPPSNSAKSSTSLMRQASNIDMYLSSTKIPILVAHGNMETYAPTDLNKRWYYSQKGNSKLKFFTPEDFGAVTGGHDWITANQTNMDIAVNAFYDFYLTTDSSTPFAPSIEYDLTNSIDPDTTFTRPNTTLYPYEGILATEITGKPAFAFDNTSYKPAGIQISSRRTNHVRNSLDFNSIAVLASGCRLEYIPDVLDPFGNPGVYKLIESDQNQIQGFRIDVTTLDATKALVGSIYIKAAENSYGFLEVADSTGTVYSRVFYNLNNYSLYDSNFSGSTDFHLGNIEYLGNGWFVISRRAFLNIQTNVTRRLRVRMLKEETTTISYQGDGSSGLYVACPQLEQCSNTGKNTIHIPTAGTIVTRQEDTFRLKQRTRTKGTMLIEFKNSKSTTTIWPNFSPILGSQTQDIISLPTVSNVRPYSKIAIAYDNTQVRYVLNGSTTAVEIPVIDFNQDLYLGGGLLDGTRADTCFTYFAEYDDFLSDSDLIKLSTIV